MCKCNKIFKKISFLYNSYLCDLLMQWRCHSYTARQEKKKESYFTLYTSAESYTLQILMVDIWPLTH